MLIAVYVLVEVNTPTIDNVFRLLGNVTLKGFEVEGITATAKLVGGVVFHAQLTHERGTVITAHAKGVHVQLTEFGETITVGIIRVAVAVRLVKRNAIRIVLIHERGIGTHMLFPHLAVHV